MGALAELLNKKKVGSLFCCNISRRVFRSAICFGWNKDYGPGDIDEYGLYTRHWSNLGCEKPDKNPDLGDIVDMSPEA